MRILNAVTGENSDVNATPDQVDQNPPPVTVNDVMRERKRRLELGFDYDFGDARGIHRIGTTEADWAGWNEVINLANALIALGDTTTTMNVVTDTGPTAVTALEWQQIMVAGAAISQQIWGASFALQAMTPIPLDYTADVYWSPQQ